MTLLNDWRHVLRKAWSIRLTIIAGLLSAMEVVLPLFMDTMPRGIFSVLTLVAVAGAFIARLTAQKEFSND